MNQKQRVISKGRNVDIAHKLLQHCRQIDPAPTAELVRLIGILAMEANYIDVILPDFETLLKDASDDLDHQLSAAHIRELIKAIKDKTYPAIPAQVPVFEENSILPKLALAYPNSTADWSKPCTILIEAGARTLEAQNEAILFPPNTLTVKNLRDELRGCAIVYLTDNPEHEFQLYLRWETISFNPNEVTSISETHIVGFNNNGRRGDPEVQGKLLDTDLKALDHAESILAACLAKSRAVAIPLNKHRIDDFQHCRFLTIDSPIYLIPLLKDPIHAIPLAKPITDVWPHLEGLTTGITL